MNSMIRTLAATSLMAMFSASAAYANNMAMPCKDKADKNCMQKMEMKSDSMHKGGMMKSDTMHKGGMMKSDTMHKEGMMESGSMHKEEMMKKENMMSSNSMGSHK